MERWDKRAIVFGNHPIAASLPICLLTRESTTKLWQTTNGLLAARRENTRISQPNLLGEAATFCQQGLETAFQYPSRSCFFLNHLPEWCYIFMQSYREQD
jgi:hypothetical protein